MKSYFYKCLTIIILTIIVAGCASGAVIITGNTREPVDPNNVIIYSEMPSNYEIIGLVTASSDSGFTDQSAINYAIIELKKQAASIGANGVVIENIGKNSSTYISGSNINSFSSINITEHTLSGKAIYVLNE